MIERVPHRAWPFYRDDLNVANYDPNEPVTVRRYTRCIPIAGAAIYPVCCVDSGGKLIWFHGPSFQDLEKGQRISVRQRTFSEAFSPVPMPLRTGLGTSQNKVLPTPFETQAPPKPGAPLVTSGNVGNSGYIAGDYIFETTDVAQEAMLAQLPPRPSSPWLAGYIDTLPLDSVIVALTPVFHVPDYVSRYSTQLAQGGAGFFLGCGARVVRYTLQDAKGGGGSVFPVAIQKRQLGPFSQEIEPAGVLTFDTADSLTVEESINVDTPLWMYLGAPPVVGGSKYSVTVQVSRQPTW